MKLFIIAAIICSVANAAAAQPASRHHGGHVDYYITIHNEMDQSIYVSCNHGRLFGIGIEASRTLIVNGPHDMGEVTCTAFDDHRNALSSKHADIPEGSREQTITFMPHSNGH